MKRISEIFESAFHKMEERNWEFIYVCVDIHDTIFKGCYNEEENHEWLGDAKECLQLMTLNPKIKLILWSSAHPSDIASYLEFFRLNTINFDYSNANPEVENTQIGCFDQKFYMNVGIDDKFGFNPETDWIEIIKYLNSRKD